jgi:hypothetical protein
VCSFCDAHDRVSQDILRFVSSRVLPVFRRDR